MTSFAGWQMPLRYGSETAEHQAVRHAAGLFDLSHMGEIVVRGPGAGEALDYALTGFISALRPGRARYTMICAADGGVLDDLVVYRQGEQEYLVIANASNTSVVLSSLEARAAGFDAVVADATDDYALIAVQGPEAAGILSGLTDLDLGAMKYYAGAFGLVAGCPCWVARTGYTGEDGFEVYCRPADAVAVWEAIAAEGAPAGLVPAGLAARDTLRLEAGMPLYGNELGPQVTPYEAGLGRVVRLDKPGDFVGRAALAARAAAGPRQTLIGLRGGSRRVPRHGYPVLSGPVLSGTAPASTRQVGVVTSGAPSPTLGVPIAMAYVEVDTKGPLGIDIRGKTEPAEITELPFYDRRK
jgi:aminomethyltransferase